MTRNNVQNRGFDVLRAVVIRHVATRESVGPETIAIGSLGVLSATICSDMTVLEEAGLTYQPHTSVGHASTDRDYCMFVDRLAKLKPISGLECHALETFLAESIDIDDVVKHSVRLLAQVAYRMALVQYPGVYVRVLKHLEIIALTPGHVLVVTIITGGEAGKHNLTLHASLDGEQLCEVYEHLRHYCDGTTSVAVQVCIDEATASARSEPVGTVAAIGLALMDILSDQSESKIVVAGATDLARGAFDFHDIAPVLDTLEEQAVLMYLFAEADPGAGIHVSIDAENLHDGLAETAVVTGTYRAGAGDSVGSARLGIVGPMCMDYVRTTGSVRAIAAYLSRYLASQHGD